MASEIFYFAPVATIASIIGVLWYGKTVASPQWETSTTVWKALVTGLLVGGTAVLLTFLFLVGSFRHAQL